MIYCDWTMLDQFVHDIYKDILELAEVDSLEYTEKMLRDDIYFILYANIPEELYETHRLHFVKRTDH